jgi:hypothetical protein
LASFWWQLHEKQPNAPGEPPIPQDRQPAFLTIEQMTIERMEHVGIVVNDLAAVTEFFVEL